MTNNKEAKIEEWEREFDDRFGGEGMIAKTDENRILIGFTKREVKDFIKKTRQEAIDWGAERERERVLKQVMIIIDAIESKNPNSSMEEWRLFKEIRNTIRANFTPQDNKD